LIFFILHIMELVNVHFFWILE